MLPDRVPHTSKVGMKNLQNLVPAFIIALAVLAGVLGGAKIISNGIVEANRFKFVQANEMRPKFFDTATGAVYEYSSGKWKSNYGQYSYKDFDTIDGISNWVWSLNYFEEELKKAR